MTPRKLLRPYLEMAQRQSEHHIPDEISDLLQRASRLAAQHWPNSVRYPARDALAEAAEHVGRLGTHLARVGRHDAGIALRQAKRAGRAIAGDPAPLIIGAAAILLTLRLFGPRKSRG